MNEEVINKIAQILIENNIDIDDYIWNSDKIVDKLYEMRDTNKYIDELTAQAQELDMGYN